MPGYGGKMRTFRPPEEGMPFGIALVWAMIDLPLAFGFRLTQAALEAPLAWCSVSYQEDTERSDYDEASNTESD